MEMDTRRNQSLGLPTVVAPVVTAGLMAASLLLAGAAAAALPAAQGRTGQRSLLSPRHPGAIHGRITFHGNKDTAINL